MKETEYASLYGYASFSLIRAEVAANLAKKKFEGMLGVHGAIGLILSGEVTGGLVVKQANPWF